MGVNKVKQKEKFPQIQFKNKMIFDRTQENRFKILLSRNMKKHVTTFNLWEVKNKIWTTLVSYK